jgi:hypothetical protein
MNTILIGIDDTDILGSTGTGRMARNLSEHLIDSGMGKCLGISRHQLLVDDRIPYTSHNSSLCISLETDFQAEDFYRPAMEFLKINFREGSDPGLCVYPADEVPECVKDFGLLAQTEVLDKNHAEELAADNGIFLVELGGTGGGIIGALAGIGLRAEGNTGRFINLPGIRDIQGTVTVSDLLARTGIKAVINVSGEPLDDGDLIDSRDWMRPSLYRCEPILIVRPRLSFAGDTTWTSVETREKEKREMKAILGLG